MQNPVNLEKDLLILVGDQLKLVVVPLMVAEAAEMLRWQRKKTEEPCKQRPQK